MPTPLITTRLAARLLAATSLLLSTALPVDSQRPAKSYKEWPREVRSFDSAFYHTDEAWRIGENVLLYQLESGAWPKNIYIPADLAPEARDAIARQKADTRRGTIDNQATTTEIRYLSHLYAATADTRHCHAALAGINYLLEAQYCNGGWPQFFPDATGYHAQITFNDDAMVGVLRLLREVASRNAPFGYVPDSVAQAALVAFDRGIRCILDCQVEQHGKPTVWCAQHDRHTLAPCQGRAYELPSLSGGESAGIVLLLMSLPQPDAEIVRAVEGAVDWFRHSAITNLKRQDFVDDEGRKDYRMVETEDAPRQWARFYETDTNRPFFCDRDGVKRYRVEDIGHERRNGYSWYNRSGERVLKAYEDWKRRIAGTSQTDGN